MIGFFGSRIIAMDSTRSDKSTRSIYSFVNKLVRFAEKQQTEANGDEENEMKSINTPTTAALDEALRKKMERYLETYKDILDQVIPKW